ncbi:putative holin-like toxin [Brochothrix thermosphacta]|uniref:putative holin-like toxin n=1 Tax=Brochothrix thermosphacta TaxID=2756 RepID=UPI000D0E69C3|nr:hypothetical protein BTH160X_30021 [Brochothrix thermosphacta]SPN74357.1 hypothetical protein BTEBP_10149 [Brochothrix thermosphacta]
MVFNINLLHLLYGSLPFNYGTYVINFFIKRNAFRDYFEWLQLMFSFGIFIISLLMLIVLVIK